MKNRLMLLAGFVLAFAFCAEAQNIDKTSSTTVIVWDIDGNVMYQCPDSDEPQRLTLGQEIDKSCTVTLFPYASLELVDNSESYKLAEAGSHKVKDLEPSEKGEKEGNLENDYIDIWDSNFGFGGGGLQQEEGKSGWGKKAGCPTPSLPNDSKVCVCDNTFTWEKGGVKEAVKFEIFDCKTEKSIFMAVTRESQLEFDISSLAIDKGQCYYWSVNPISKGNMCADKVKFEAISGEAQEKVLDKLETGEEYKKSNNFVKLLKKAKALEEAGMYYAADEVYREASHKYDNSVVEMMQTRNARRTEKK